MKVTVENTGSSARVIPVPCFRSVFVPAAVRTVDVATDKVNLVAGTAEIDKEALDEAMKKPVVKNWFQTTLTVRAVKKGE